MIEPIFLQGVCKDYLWGGSRLRTEFGRTSSSAVIAESWELAAHPDGSSRLCSGAHAGMALDDYLRLMGIPSLLGTHCAECDTLPVLIKLIDAKQDLSIQVHPDDAYAKAVEGERGKTEMWYILDAQPGASLYYGVNAPVSKAEFAQRIQNETLPEILHRVEVQPGELYFIPAGTLHAIGAGILLAEIQENSNTTYRVYDYGRRGADGKLRPLHVDKALDVANLSPTLPTVQHPAVSIEGGTHRKLAVCDYFAASLVTVTSRTVFSVDASTFQHLLFLQGSGTLETSAASYSVRKGTSVLLPAGMGGYSIHGSCQYLLTKMDRPVH